MIKSDKDLYEQGQKYGKYHLYSFDIKNSRNLEKRAQAQVLMFELSYLMYEELKKIEKKLQKKILADDLKTFEEDLKKKYCSKYINTTFLIVRDPFIQGDSFVITLYRDAIEKEIVIGIYEKYKKFLNIDFDFHLFDGYYETHDWVEGDKKYCRSDAVKDFTTMHKIETNKRLKFNRKYSG